MTRRLASPSIGLAVGVLLFWAPHTHAGRPRLAAAQSQDASALCKDSAGDLYSEGAMVEAHGQLMRCVIGPHWEPVDAGEKEPTPSVLDIAGENIEASQGASIIDALRGKPLPLLDCDTVLNSDLSPTQLLRVPPSTKLLVLFWTPTCAPCKPLLADLAAVAETKPRDVNFLGVVQSANPELDPPGEFQLRRVEELMTQYRVGFPTCVHSSNDTSRRWQAQGVPLMLLISPESGVERAALGRRNGEQLLHELTNHTSGVR